MESHILRPIVVPNGWVDHCDDRCQLLRPIVVPNGWVDHCDDRGQILRPIVVPTGWVDHYDVGGQMLRTGVVRCFVVHLASPSVSHMLSVPRQLHYPPLNIVQFLVCELTL